MNDVERRLLHASRDLREVRIDPPPLVSIGRPERRSSGLVTRFPALVMPVLFVLGGLAVVAGGLGSTTADVGPPAATAPTAPAAAGASARPREAIPARPDVSGEPVLTARQEVALIASLQRDPGTRSAEPAGRATGEVRSLHQRYQ